MLSRPGYIGVEGGVTIGLDGTDSSAAVVQFDEITIYASPLAIGLRNMQKIFCESLPLERIDEVFFKCGGDVEKATQYLQSSESETQQNKEQPNNSSNLLQKHNNLIVNIKRKISANKFQQPDDVKTTGNKFKWVSPVKLMKGIYESRFNTDDHHSQPEDNEIVEAIDVHISEEDASPLTKTEYSSEAAVESYEQRENVASLGIDAPTAVEESVDTTKQIDVTTVEEVSTTEADESCVTTVEEQTVSSCETTNNVEAEDIQQQIN